MQPFIKQKLLHVAGILCLLMLLPITAHAVEVGNQTDLKSAFGDAPTDGTAYTIQSKTALNWMKCLKFRLAAISF